MLLLSLDMDTDLTHADPCQVSPVVMEDTETDLEDGDYTGSGVGGFGTTIAALQHDLFVRVSGGEFQFRRFVKMLLTITLLCPMLAVSCHPTLLRRSPSSLAHEELDMLTNSEPQLMCFRDEHCAPGSFCHDPTKSCVPCLLEECSKWKRLPSTTTKCIKSQEHCGNCLPGYSDQHGHCQPTNYNVLNHGKSNQSVSAKAPPVGQRGKTESDFLVLNWSLLGVILGLVFLSTSTPFFIYIFKRCRGQPPSKSSQTGDREGILESGEFLRPPPYNPNMTGRAPPFYPDQGYSWTTSSSPQPPNIQEENPTMAIAFRTGRFPTLNQPEEVNTGEEEQQAQLPTEASGEMEIRSESDPLGIMDVVDESVQDLEMFEESVEENRGIVMVDAFPEPALLDVEFLIELVVNAQVELIPIPPPSPSPPNIFHPDVTPITLESILADADFLPGNVDSSDRVVPNLDILSDEPFSP